MLPGVAGVPLPTVTARVLGALLPQMFPEVTEILPFCPADPVVTVTLVVPFAEVIVQPAGTDHV
jgi:hypothetical protein